MIPIYPQNIGESFSLSAGHPPVVSCQDLPQPHADPELLGYYLQKKKKRILAPTSVFLKHPWEKQEKKDMIKNKHVNPGKKNPKPPSPGSL